MGFLLSGHRIEETPEVPLVVSDKVQAFAKTKEAMIFLKRNKAHNDVDQVKKLTSVLFRFRRINSGVFDALFWQCIGGTVLTQKFPNITHLLCSDWSILSVVKNFNQ